MIEYLVLGAVTVVTVVYVLVVVLAHTPRAHTECELFYRTNGGITGELPAQVALHSELIDSIEMSVVVPCYNETTRLEKMLDEAVEVLEREFPGKYEILLIDDGSSDGTAEFALELAANKYKLGSGVLRCVQLSQNRGKGGAVRHGMLFSRGKYGIFADADGASKFGDVVKLKQSIEAVEGPAIAIGSRAHMVNSDSVVKRSFIRNFLMYSLHALVYVFGIREIKDTQCGFKLFNRDAIAQTFTYLHNERWIFDVELLIIAIRKSIPIKEIPISWHEVDGSKVDLARDSIAMAIDLVVTRMAYLLGVYSDSP